MCDRLEKVRGGLKACSVGIECGPNCPYEWIQQVEGGCVAALARDALALLDAQEAPGRKRRGRC